MAVANGVSQLTNVTRADILAHFPHTRVRQVQDLSIDQIVARQGDILLELPTGSGKTALAIATLLAFAAKFNGPVYLVTPTKTQVDQHLRTYPGRALPVFGRAEYPCLYYENRGRPGINAQQSPCYMLKCGHRVDQTTGLIEEQGLEPCPYFQAKYEAAQRATQGGLVICTLAFYLLNRLRVSNWRAQEPALVVIDEAHNIARVSRSLFEHTITDFHLRRLIEAVGDIDKKQVRILKRFLQTFRRIAKARGRTPCRPNLINEEEIARLVEILRELDADGLEGQVRAAIDSGAIDPVEDRDTLKLLENLVRNIPRMISALEFACESENRRPLNYVVAFYYRREENTGTRGSDSNGRQSAVTSGGNGRDSQSGSDEGRPDRRRRRQIRTYLTIKAYYVVPLIRTTLGERTMAMSATIGNAGIFGHESGLRMPFFSAPSTFPPAYARLYLPTDTPNLSRRMRRRNDLPGALNTVADTAVRFAQAGHRSLVVVISEEEREKFLRRAARRELRVVTYGQGVTAREAATRFAGGEGQVLVGTAAQYGEGVDLPGDACRVIFFLRPGYPRPDDPEVMFEERRFPNGHIWALRNWRVMIEALQCRGRNVRSAHDKGVCFFISQTFRRFVYNSLPPYLALAYRDRLTMEQAVRDALDLLR